MRLNLVATYNGTQGPYSISRRTCTPDTLGIIVAEILLLDPKATFEVNQSIKLPAEVRHA